MTDVQEIVPKPEFELQEFDVNSQEGSGETTQELFRREASPRYEGAQIIKSPETPTSPPSSPRTKTPNKYVAKTSRVIKKDETTKKKSNSGIPLRLKSGTSTVSAKNEKKMGSYRHAPPPPNLGPVINRNTLEMQFINNKKRLLQLHSELVEKQRPLMDMHKSLLRTKKQLEELGKKVVLEEIKMVTLKTDDFVKSIDAASEITAAETAMNLKTAIDNVLDSCVKVCKRCLLKRDHVVKVLEEVSNSVADPDHFETELEELKREKVELEQTMESTFKENEGKITEFLNNWQKSVKTKTLSNDVSTKMAELEETIVQQQKAIADAEDNMHSLTRKYEDKKFSYEKTISELHEKTIKLEDELKKEKRSANENLLKSRNLRTKVTELEVRTREAEEKHGDVAKKLSQLQEQLRKKEVQWLKEKDDFKKNEELLQQKFSEKQSQFDTRCLVNITLKALNELIMPSVVYALR